MTTPLLDIAEALSAFADDAAPSQALVPRGRTDAHERRAHLRLRPLDLPRPVLARLKYGPLVRLLDVSEGGALVETAARLTPGAQLMLEFLAPGRRRTTMIPSRVMHSQVTSLESGLRYRGGCAFTQLLHIAEMDVRRDEPDIGRADARALADAIGSIRSVASGSRDHRVARLLDEIVREVQARPSPRALMAFVEQRLRRHVPLLSVAFATRPRVQHHAGECLAFELGQTDSDGLQRVHIEFKPACTLDDAQVRLLHAGASAMSLIFGWHRTPFGGR